MGASLQQDISSLIGRRRRGFASVMAMFFLVLFAVLAVGFAEATLMSSQIAVNERNADSARLAAESGMAFIRYQLGSITLPSGTTSSNLMANLATVLGASLNGTTNMGTNTVAVSNNEIYIPSANSYITSDSTLQTGFQVTIAQSGTNLVVTSRGNSPASGVTRAIQLQYQPAPGSSSILDYGIAAAGPITISGNATVKGVSSSSQGSVLSATAQAAPLTIGGNGVISGDFSDTNAAGTVSTSGNITIGGYSPTNPNYASHIHKGIAPPTFPTVDTSAYAPYATNISTGGSGNLTVVNAVIPPNTNPTFSGNINIQGVMYIETPNKVSFSGNLNIQGAIVVANNPTGSSNSITFGGNFTATTMDTLPANSTFPAGERALVGSFLLAPTFAVSFGGNFGTIGGSMVADSFTFSGNTSGTVAGSIIALQDDPFKLTGNSSFIFGAPVTSTPTGLTFPGGYAPSQGTYIEVQ